ncbi:DUF1624 domain-containing protein [Denitromonas sp. IR12]|uniref:DUF1624 domain-containing protein n=1 Tax=Denitromonas iodatirespirans TaxID=2795389 RepID=A0A944DDE0_DENI1|nr:DUF1624 domain-containing protein [Denitromonas iodatirespirans]
MPDGLVSGRILAIDVLRGLVMALMLVDHVREYFYLHLQVADPMDVAGTAPALFFTRLTSHVCAPVFVFLTGIGAWLYGHKHVAPRRAASAYLFKRGVFLVLLELSVVNFAWTFSLPPQMIYLQVIWAIGLSMIALSALLWLPWPALLAVAIGIIAGHNALDGLHVAAGDAGFVPWAILHDRSIIDLGAGLRARTSYPVLPWIGVIALGYVAGRLYQRDVAPERRRRVWWLAGAGALLGFVVLRATGAYGQAALWQPGQDPLETLMSFVNVTKYPPSLLFLLLTLGVGLLALARLERGTGRLAVLAQFGRAPMFFYILHLYVLHLLYLAALTLWGSGDGGRFSVGHVWQIWALAVALLALLYLPCRAFANYKRNSRKAWLSYF